VGGWVERESVGGGDSEWAGNNALSAVKTIIVLSATPRSASIVCRRGKLESICVSVPR
jgi:hypothetical protein